LRGAIEPGRYHSRVAARRRLSDAATRDPTAIGTIGASTSRRSLWASMLSPAPPPSGARRRSPHPISQRPLAGSVRRSRRAYLGAGASRYQLPRFSRSTRARTGSAKSAALTGRSPVVARATRSFLVQSTDVTVQDEPRLIRSIRSLIGLWMIFTFVGRSIRKSSDAGA
jgi:hypothetical protein